MHREVGVKLCDGVIMNDRHVKIAVRCGENGWLIGFVEFLVIRRGWSFNEPWEIGTEYANSCSHVYYTYYAVI